MTVENGAENTTNLGERLIEYIEAFDGVLIAFSGGVDSAAVAAAAQRALGSQALAVTSVSPSVPQSQIQIAKQVAVEIGIQHRVVITDEVERAEYAENSIKRCFFCKQTLYGALHKIAVEEGLTILSGTNADDLGDYRPGIDAGREANVRTPLADLGIGKQAVRSLAKAWGLSVWDLPAAPCLASRIAYGLPVTVERLRSVELAESWLRECGFDHLRVRYHHDDLARIEVAADRIAELVEPSVSQKLLTAFQSFGFRYVTIDLAGFRSGNLNHAVETLPMTYQIR